jgi:bifunctional non-homologous end joining protein LigD
LQAQAGVDLPFVVDRTALALRGGKVFVDWSQNDPMESTVAPYSLRATRTPAVSTPVTWAEVQHALATGSPAGLVAGPDEALRRLERHGDLFHRLARRSPPRRRRSRRGGPASAVL